MKNPSVSAIVCAYNEAKTIKPILRTLINHPKIDEVIAVDDGSTDRTGKIIDSIKNDKLVKIHHPKNLGKGAAVVSAVKKSKQKILLFIDADLKNLNLAHIDMLLMPLIINRKCMTIGVRDPHLPHEKSLAPLFKSFGGERALMKNQITRLMGRIEKSGYGIEAILNLHFLRHRWPIYYIPLPKLIHVLKEEKHPIYKFIIDYMNEGAEIAKQFFSSESRITEILLQKIAKKLKI